MGRHEFMTLMRVKRTWTNVWLRPSRARLTHLRHGGVKRHHRDIALGID
jgi:hypothetical protein